MAFKAGGIAALAAVVGGGYFMITPQGDPGDPAHVAAFKVTCQRAAGGMVALDYCRCIARNLDGQMKNPTEHELAAQIMRAMGQTISTAKTFGTSSSTTREVLQSKFDRISKDFHGRVSIPRKQAVLQAVVREVKACERELSQASR